MGPGLRLLFALLALSALLTALHLTVAHSAQSDTAALLASKKKGSPPQRKATTPDHNEGGDPASSCSKKPYHVLLTASSGPFQRWQTRVFHHHYLQIKKQNTCTEMGGFTRLLTLPSHGPQTDDLFPIMKTVVATELKRGTEDLGFVVLNRPSSLLQVLQSGKLQMLEEFVLITETDHIFMKPLPNLAEQGLAVGYKFHYMSPRRDSQTVSIIKRFAGSSWTKVQQVGPSPLLISQADLRRVVGPWKDMSFAMKRDPEADAKFHWMLEMWGYTVAAATVNLTHVESEDLQIEPSSQFGTSVYNGPTPTHYILHYTFSHEFSYDGVPMIDTRYGEWRFDKRPFQKGITKDLEPPPRCATEAAWTLWRRVYEAANAESSVTWENGDIQWDHEAIKTSVRGLAASENAAKLVASGPWKWNDDTIFFLRGGFAFTPWGTARWGVAPNGAPDGHEFVLFLCGVERWTHSFRLVSGDSEAGKLRIRPAPPPQAAGLAEEGEDITGSSRDESIILSPSSFIANVSGDAKYDAVAALESRDALVHDKTQNRWGRWETDPRKPANVSIYGDSDASAVRRRLLGTGPWRIEFGRVFLLANGRLSTLDGVQGTWKISMVKGAAVLTAQVGSNTGRYRVDCWKLTNLDSAVSIDFIWSAPARRCFPTCDYGAPPPTEAQLQASRLSQLVTKVKWSWGFNREGVAFEVQNGVTALKTPWGHGIWGPVPSHPDVIFAEFAQQVHMLRFDNQRATFVSTRCSDGDKVGGAAMGSDTKWWKFDVSKKTS